jgi:hypothetical protein
VGLLGIFKRETPVERFWIWFSGFSTQVSQYEEDRDRVFDALSSRLAEIHESLTFEIGPAINGRREFIISANGDKTAFPSVVDLTARAPDFEEWVVIPFRPPKDLSRFRKINYGGSELSVDDVWFTDEVEGETVHLEIFIRGLTENNHDQLAGAAFILLDTALGEYVVETRIGGIEFHPLGDTTETMRPLREIVGIIELPNQ